MDSNSSQIPSNIFNHFADTSSATWSPDESDNPAIEADLNFAQVKDSDIWMKLRTCREHGEFYCSTLEFFLTRRDLDKNELFNNFLQIGIFHPEDSDVQEVDSYGYCREISFGKYANTHSPGSSAIQIIKHVLEEISRPLV
jgi:hypothetical protein